MAELASGELERMLRKAVSGLRVAPSPGARHERAKLIRRLVQRLFAARLNWVQAKTLAAGRLTGSRPRRHGRAQQPYWHREEELKKKGVYGILDEFNIPAAVWENAVEIGDWRCLLSQVAPEITSVLPLAYWAEPGLVLSPTELASVASLLERSLKGTSNAPVDETRAVRLALYNLRRAALANQWWLPVPESLQRAIASSLTYCALYGSLDLARRLLVDLTEHSRRLDAVVALRIHNMTATAPVWHVVWRGGSVARESDNGARLVQLASPTSMAEQTWGVLYKAFDTWLWTEGVRDEVLAVIPDTFFEPAVDAALSASPLPEADPSLAGSVDTL